MMKTEEILNELSKKPEVGLQLTKRSGILTSTWLLYLRIESFYCFNISEEIVINDNSKYTKTEMLHKFKNCYFEIDCEVF